MGSAPSPPQPTDPGAAAKAQRDSDVATSGFNVVAQNPNEIGPTGSVSYDLAGYEFIEAPNYDRNGKLKGYTTIKAPRYNRVTNLSPAEQAKYDTETALMLQLGDVAHRQIGQASERLSQPFDISSIVPELGSYWPEWARIENQRGAPGSVPDFLSWDNVGNRDNVQAAMMSRLEPQLARRREMERTRLANQGITEGSQAYNEAMGQIGQTENDAVIQAYLGAGDEMSRLASLRGQAVNENVTNFNQAAQIRQEMDALRGQTIQEALMERQIPLNEISAAMSGSQVNMPQAQAFRPAPLPNTPIADYMYKSKDQEFQAYNAQLQAHNAKMSGMFGMIGSLARLPFGGLMG